MVRKIEVGKKFFVSELEIKLFCNKNYEGQGERGTVLDCNGDRLKIRLDKELNIQGYKYKDILINTSAYKISEKEKEYAFAMQDSYFKSCKKLN